jgi:opacity protein-like surface antigen
MKKLMLTAALIAALAPAAAFAQSAPKAGNYTIDLRTSGDQMNGFGNDPSTNRNTDRSAIQRTIDANPGLAEKLADEGIKTSDIGNISVEPNGKVIVYKL